MGMGIFVATTGLIMFPFVEQPFKLTHELAGIVFCVAVWMHVLSHSRSFSGCFRRRRSLTACGETRASAEPPPGELGARRPADKAREAGIPSVFRPKRNDERRKAARFSRDGSHVERRAGFATGC